MKFFNRQSEEPKKETKAPGEDRLIMLCDGIFAIAITLLVLDIKVAPLPDNIKNTAAQAFVHDNMVALLSKVMIYLITFFIIASYWTGHRRMMQYIKHIDGTFIQLTFLFMAFIVFFPVSFGIVTEYGAYPESVIFYTLVLAGCGFSSQLIWLYASTKHRLIDSDVAHDMIISRSMVMLISPIYFCLSMLLLFIPYFHQNPANVYYSWTLLAIIAANSQNIRKFLAKYIKTQEPGSQGSDKPAQNQLVQHAQAGEQNVQATHEKEAIHSKIE